MPILLPIFRTMFILLLPFPEGMTVVNASDERMDLTQARHASATSLVAVLGTGIVSAILYGIQGQVDMVGAATLAFASVLSAPAGARMTMRIDNKKLKMLMGAFLMLVAPAVPLRDALLFGETKGDDAKATKKEVEPANEEERQVFAKALWRRIEESPGFMQLADNERARYVGALLATGGLAGFLSGLLGIGGGMIVTPVLALTSGMPQVSSASACLPPSLAPAQERRVAVSRRRILFLLMAQRAGKKSHGRTM